MPEESQRPGTTDTSTTPPLDFPTFVAWLNFGVSEGWVSEISCATHAGIPTTTAEDEEEEEGYDPCLFVLRVWDA